MERLSYPLLALLAHWFTPQFNARLQFLEAQLRMLRSRLDTNRIVPSEQEKDELLRLGAQFDHDVGELMHVVRLKTYRKWLNRQRGLRRVRRAGRPRMPVALRHLIERIGEGNPNWGYRRVVGELKKLGFRIGATTVRTVLREAGIPTGPTTPTHQASIPWRTFIHANLDSIVASDFFTKKIYTMHGVVTAYVLVFIHLGSRKVYCSRATCSPNEQWVLQQARNASMWLDDEGIEARFILHDRDTKYSQAFREFWRSNGTERIRSPIQAPKANAFAESFIGTMKRECLNHFMCFSRDQLDYITSTWVRHYNTERPHRGVGMNNEVLDRAFQPQSYGTVRCKQQLGGLIKSYYRDAA